MLKSKYWLVLILTLVVSTVTASEFIRAFADGPVINSGTFSTGHTEYSMKAFGEDVWRKSGGGKVHPKAYRISGDNARYAFKVPTDLYPRITRFSVEVLYDNVDYGGLLSDIKPKLYCYDYENNHYDKWRDLEETGDGSYKWVKVETPDVHKDDASYHIAHPGHKEEYQITVKIEAPSDILDNADVDIDEVHVTLSLDASGILEYEFSALKDYVIPGVYERTLKIKNTAPKFTFLSWSLTDTTNGENLWFSDNQFYKSSMSGKISGKSAKNVNVTLTVPPPNTLLINPGAEDGLNGWEQANVNFDTIDGMLRQASSGDHNITPHSGNHYFDGNQSRFTGIRQVIENDRLAPYISAIDSGVAKIVFTGYFRSWPDDNDAPELRLICYDGGGNELTHSFSDRQNVDNNWKLFGVEINPVPQGTRKIIAQVESFRKDGTNNDGYIDDLALCIFPIPPMSQQQLLENPGAENGLTGWLDATGDIDGGTDIITGPFVQANSGDNVDAHSSDHYFFGGQNSISGIKQIIEGEKLAPYLTMIASGNARAVLSGYLNSDGDQVEFRMRCYDENDTQVAKNFCGRQSPAKVWKRYEVVLDAIPTNTKKITIQLEAIRNADTDNDGYIDDMAFYIAGRSSALLSKS